MGDAKRRKALGLMPTVYGFEVELNRDGELTPVTLPADEAQREQILQALKDSQPTGANWDQFYRTEYVTAGLPQERLVTLEDVDKIAVPPRRRLAGDLATWAGGHKPEVGDLPVKGAENTWLRIRTRQHAFENQSWQQFAPMGDPEEWLSYLFQHPALQLKGDVVGRYSAEQTQDGKVSWTPAPPDGQQEAFDKLSRSWHGETPEEWLEIHAERLGEDQADVTAPQALRSGFELREPAPLSSPFASPFDLVGSLEVFPVRAEQAYSLDGQTWQDYPEDEDTEDDDFGDFTDVESFGVTVWADGRMEWPKDALDAVYAQRLTEELEDYTGAGQADGSDWTTYTEEALRSFYDLDDVSALPPVQGVRLSVPTDIYEDEDESAGFEAKVIEDEVTFDGQVWHDLYEELPESLLSPQEN
ncbi:hypothetical protein [Deinococcus sp.]|uniref:hypothetical protein n=1 Tax=Deinococcus sp. TaxID=47478 RepID=UPI003B596FDA